MLTLYKMLYKLWRDNAKNNNYDYDGLVASIYQDWPTSDQWDEVKAKWSECTEFEWICVSKELANLMYLDGDTSLEVVEAVEAEIQRRLEA